MSHTGRMVNVRTGKLVEAYEAQAIRRHHARPGNDLLSLTQRFQQAVLAANEHSDPAEFRREINKACSRLISIMLANHVQRSR